MPESFEEMWAALLPIGRTEGGGYERRGLGEVERHLHNWLVDQGVARGLEVERDATGNTLLWWAPASGQRGEAVLTGSHLDSVPHGGAYDGPLGVVSALAAIDLLRADGFEPVRPVAVAAFVDEEGAGSGQACHGSRQALALGEAWLDRVGCYVELHVEQGRALEAPVGVGTGIAPHGRWRLDFTGTPDHAGSTGMADRHDPVLTFAMTALAANKQARLSGARATMARVEVVPNATNAIASRVTAWLDARAGSDEALEALVGEIARQGAQRADRDGTSLRVSAESSSGAVAFDASLVDRVARLLGAPTLPTYAGHDAGVLQAAGIPSVKLFVRNPTGGSHSPAEHATPEDCLAGVTALAAVLQDLSG